MSIMSSPPLGRDTPDIIVDKVLRRVEVAKVQYIEVLCTSECSLFDSY